jgi:hypothetical protein
MIYNLDESGLHAWADDSYVSIVVPNTQEGPEVAILVDQCGGRMAELIYIRERKDHMAHPDCAPEDFQTELFELGYSSDAFDIAFQEHRFISTGLFE